MGEDCGVNGDLNANLRCHSTGDPQLDKAVHRWLTWDKVSVCPPGGQLHTAVCCRSCGGTGGGHLTSFVLKLV